MRPSRLERRFVKRWGCLATHHQGGDFAGDPPRLHLECLPVGLCPTASRAALGSLLEAVAGPRRERHREAPPLSGRERPFRCIGKDDRDESFLPCIHGLVSLFCRGKQQRRATVARQTSARGWRRQRRPLIFPSHSLPSFPDQLSH